MRIHEVLKNNFYLDLDPRHLDEFDHDHDHDHEEEEEEEEETE